MALVCDIPMNALDLRETHLASSMDFAVFAAATFGSGHVRPCQAAGIARGQREAAGHFCGKSPSFLGIGRCYDYAGFMDLVMDKQWISHG